MTKTKKDTKYRKNYYEGIWDVSSDYIKDPGERQAYRKLEPDTEVRRFFYWVKRRKKEGSVLDIGCGAGRHSILFAREGFNVKGFDISENAIKIARKLSKEENLDIKFSVSDIFNYKDNEKHDIIIDYGLLHHLPKKYWKGYKKKIMNLSKPGSYLFLFVFSRRTIDFNGIEIKGDHKTVNGEYNHFFTIKEIKELFPEFKIEFKKEKKTIDRKSSSLAFYLKRKK